MVYKFLITSSKVAVLTLLLNKLEQLGEELHTPTTRKFEKRKVNSSFRNNIWSADLEDMLLISKFNKGICFLFCVIDILSNYEWIVPLKGKEELLLLMLFKKF